MENSDSLWRRLKEGKAVSRRRISFAGDSSVCQTAAEVRGRRWKGWVVVVVVWGGGSGSWAD